MYTAGSFTKNFGWRKSFKKLHTAIQSGFGELAPITRGDWREQSGVADVDRQLLPLNFFLYTRRGITDDFVLVDRLVERAFEDYHIYFGRLALFAFHLACSGTWQKSKWPDGKVAGWANELIQTFAWNSGKWGDGAFTKQSLASFLAERLHGEAVTKRKVRNNYRYMLTSAGVLIDDKVQATDIRQSWVNDAVQLFYDRQVFGGELHRASSQRDFETAFFREGIHKLLNCAPDQGRAIALSVHRDYAARLLPLRLEQLAKLRSLLAA